MSLLAHTDLLAHLQALEVELHHPGRPCERERLEQLLHPDFHEVGRSGLPYDRRTVIDFLATQAEPPAVVSDAFALVELGPDVALLTFRSAQVEAGQNLTRHTLRSSLWLRTERGWQLRYHQGTPAAKPWTPTLSAD